MDIKKIGSRGVMFTFEAKECPMGGGTSVYLIEAPTKLFLCDTHLGTISMEHIKKYLKENQVDKDIVVFNSHSDFDHIWGNCAFKGSDIVAHELCKKRIKERGAFDLERLKHFHNGVEKLVLPNVTFKDKIEFDDEVEFIYTPGHTVDSCICYDKKDSVIFVGDLIEEPVPVINHNDIKAYIESLEYIKKLGATTIISAHSGIINLEILDNNLEYLRKLINGNMIDSNFEGIYAYNVKNLLIIEHEKIARKKLKDKFDYRRFKCKLWSEMGVDFEGLAQEALQIIKADYKELEKALKRCRSSLGTLK